MVFTLESAGGRLDPAGRVADRGPKRVTLHATIAPGSTILLSTRPGSAHNYNRDWACWTEVVID